jgi:phosphopantetheinyl transferase (holo-ACP synthase)
MNLQGGNVIGVGVDLTEVARIRAAHARHGDAFVAILSGPEGEPVVELDDRARALLAKRGATRLLVSLTHTDDLAQAFAVLVR